MLTSARFQNFKILRDITVPLSPFTVLIGPNGVGKSSVLDGIFGLLQLGNPAYGYTSKVYDRPYVYFQGEISPKYLLGSAQTFILEVSAKNSDSFGLEVQVGQDKEMKQVNLWHRQDEQMRKLTLPDPNNKAKEFFDVPGLQQLASVMRLGLDAQAIASPSAAVKGIPHLAVDGSGLPSLLAHIALRRGGTIERIEEAMKHLVHGFRRIEVVESAAMVLQDQRWVEKEGFGIEVEFDGVGRVPAFHLSEGTRILLALLTLLHAPTRPRLILLDDLDRALHPQAQVELVGLLHRLVEETPDLQIIATAHSPIVVGRCAKNEVVVLKRNDDGSTGIAHPTDAPGILSTSELLNRYFALPDTLGASVLIQEYGLYASDACRTDAEDQRMRELEQKLKSMGIDQLFPPLERK